MVISFFMLAILVDVFIFIFNSHHYGYWYHISTTIINNLNILRCSAYSGNELEFGSPQDNPHFWHQLQVWRSPRSPSLLIWPSRLGVSKTTCKFDNWLEGPTALTENLLKVMVYYSKRIYFKISQGKRCHLNIIDCACVWP